MRFSLPGGWDGCSVLQLCAGLRALCAVFVSRSNATVLYLNPGLKKMHILVLMQNSESRVAKHNPENSQIQANVCKPALHYPPGLHLVTDNCKILTLKFSCLEEFDISTRLIKTFLVRM